MASMNTQAGKQGFRIGSMLIGLAASAMLIAAGARWPYSYYTAIRWGTLAAVGVLIFRGHILRLQWPWGLVVVGVIFNPLAPLHLSRNVWAVLDVIGAACLLAAVVGLEWPEIVRLYRAGGSQRRRLLLLLATVIVAYAGAVDALLALAPEPQPTGHTKLLPGDLREPTGTRRLPGDLPD
jgi:hypothetical protein